MRFKEAFHGAVKVKAVLLVVKTMSFVVFYHIFYHHTPLSQRLNHLVAFSLVYTWVISSLSHKQGHFNFVGMQSRRCGGQLVGIVLGVSHLFVHHFEHGGANRVVSSA